MITNLDFTMIAIALIIGIQILMVFLFKIVVYDDIVRRETQTKSKANKRK